MQLLLLSLSLVLILLHSPTAFSAEKCHPDDESGLLGFKSGITHDPSGLLSTWKKGTYCCNWNGVSCQTIVANSSRVNSISVYGDPSKHTAGTISPSLAKLTYLDGIYLQNLPGLTGPFPRFLFRLPHLLFVYIEDNALSGPLPADIGNMTQLGALSVQGNRFSGSIPASISKLTQLTQLKLGRNSFTGGIPLGLRNLEQLTYLSLEENRLSSTIPDFFSSFSQLAILNLSYNMFSGQIPKTISSLAPQLQYLELAHNGLTGQIPDYLGNFRKLDTLDLSMNRLTGTVPKTFANLTKIFNLRLAHNYLVDPFPTMYVKGIQSLDLSYNNFHLGLIPKWVTSSPIVNSLNLAGCGLTFNLGNWKPSETYFYDYIDLSDNNLSGSPVALLNSTDYLVGFSASGNKLKFDMGTLKFSTKLNYLDLSRNSVYGKLPNIIAGLQKLNVSYNHLCGRIPSSKFPASAFVNNDCLCGSPLPACR